MPRPKKVIPPERETQRFPIDNGAVVVIKFDPAKRPKMVYLDGVVIIGEHVCGGIVQSQFHEPSGEQIGPSLDEIKEFQRLREAQVVRKPFTSEDAARENGFNPAALSFENISVIAASMPQPEESLVE